MLYIFNNLYSFVAVTGRLPLFFYMISLLEYRQNIHYYRYL